MLPAIVTPPVGMPLAIGKTLGMALLGLYVASSGFACFQNMLFERESFSCSDGSIVFNVSSVRLSIFGFSGRLNMTRGGV